MNDNSSTLVKRSHFSIYLVIIVHPHKNSLQISHPKDYLNKALLRNIHYLSDNTP